MESQAASFLFGVEVTNGRNRWKVERPLENSYTTPLLVRSSAGVDVVVQATGGLTAYDSKTGAKRWTFDDDGVSSIASPIAADGLILATGREMVALRPAAVGPPEVVWRSARLGCGTATPLTSLDMVYALKDSGILTCGDLKTGKLLWSERLRGSYSASPVMAGDRLYMVNEDGETTVMRAGGKPKRVATNPLNDAMLATPAVAGGSLFLRSDRWLYCVSGARVPNR
jgi:outer membrane protein assembly factor BamB